MSYNCCMATVRRYRLPDGIVIEGTTDAELVDAMAQTKMTDASSRASYRRGTARRAKVMNEDVRIRTNSDQNFIEDLVREGLLESLD